MQLPTFRHRTNFPGRGPNAGLLPRAVAPLALWNRPPNPARVSFRGRSWSLPVRDSAICCVFIQSFQRDLS